MNEFCKALVINDIVTKLLFLLGLVQVAESEFFGIIQCCKEVGTVFIIIRMNR